MTPVRLACALAVGLVFCLAVVHGASPAFKPDSARSVSGQFLVSVTPNNSPFFRRPDVSTNTDILRLEAPWLVVSAERFKAALWRELGLPPDSSWSGKIFLVLHSSRRLDEPVLITSQPFIHYWNYRLEMPDLINRNRYAWALSAAMLLEMANRHTPLTRQPAEIPAWLVDGLARQIAESTENQAILSAPNKSVDSFAIVNSGPTPMSGGMLQTRQSENQRGLDSLTEARKVLQNHPALTFDQLSWPDDTQLNGADGGVYLASAQLFVDELLALKSGPAKMRAFLAQLPACQNWQSAFFTAFRDNFRRPLDVEKWWALRVVAFAAHAPGPQWSVAVSCEKLDAALVVPVEVRPASNALPSRAEYSLQSAVRAFAPPRQTEILRTKLRDLELVQFRLPPSLAAVAADYAKALADFLGERKKRFLFFSAAKPKSVQRSPKVTDALLRKLDELDARRREVEAKFDRQTLHLRSQ